MSIPTPVEMSREELRVAIREEQGWFRPSWNGIRCSYWVRTGGRPTAFLSDPTIDISATVEMLNDLNCQKPHESGHYPVITGCGTYGWRLDVMFQPDSDAEALEFSVTAPTVELAVCLAWYQFKTGTRISLTTPT